ncbi:hypothetical protein J1605_003566 [Eschrichtius robustus]|uniref:Uncharacterized protein n=1 Tax=Eschrichtius robustus TaxID=9764 RepID=A0AB34HS60_ESCRO|nr:hypothetical protein J1605_003566 [Eschrichtius robustus]
MGRGHTSPSPGDHARPPALSGSPVISDISSIRLSPHPAGPGESPFNAPHPYVSSHVEQYLCAVHGSPTHPAISAARGLSPADVAHEHLKERGLFGLPPPGTNPSDYYHQMTLMAGHPTPYGDLLMQSGGAAGAPHLHDYLNPVDGKARPGPGPTGGPSRAVGDMLLVILPRATGTAVTSHQHAELQETGLSILACSSPGIKACAWQTDCCRRARWVCELTCERAEERTSGQNSIQVRWRLAFAQVPAEPSPAGDGQCGLNWGCPSDAGGQFSCSGGGSTLTRNPAARTSCISLAEGTYGVWAGLSRPKGGRRASRARDPPSTGVVSRFSSPRVTPRLSRKRALSISPLSDASLDLQRMIRTSPNSLVAYINNSRSSSAASGSYGHLSAGTLSPAFTFPHPINPVAYQQILSQQRGLGSAFGHTPPLIQPSPTFLAQQPTAFTSINATSTQLNSSSNCLSDANQNKQSSESAVSSTVNPLVIHKRSKVKTEAEGLQPASPLTVTQEQLADLKEDLDRDECKQEAEVVVYETNCHWEDCTKEYDSQEQLVHVSPRAPAACLPRAQPDPLLERRGSQRCLGHLLCKRKA